MALCDASGTVNATWIYDVFGAVRSHTGGTTGFTFTGEQTDASTGLEYLPTAPGRGGTAPAG